MAIHAGPKGDTIRITLTTVEAQAVRDLSERQELNHAQVIRQALRLYQNQVMGPINGPRGCSADN